MNPKVLEALQTLRAVMGAEYIRGRGDLDVAIVQFVTGDPQVDGLAGPMAMKYAIEWLERKWRERDPRHSPEHR